jgi:hypothetical protein
MLALALILVFQPDTVSVRANPQNTSNESRQKLQAAAKQPKGAKLEATNEEFELRTIRTHVPAAGQFSKRRERIWETLKRNYAQKKNISHLLRQYLKMDDAVNRGTNWVIDDAGNYTRMRPLSVQCRELEEKLDLPWQTVGK